MASPNQDLPDVLQQIENPEHREVLRRAFEAAPAVDHITRDIVWAEVDGVELTLDAYWNDGTEPQPILVWIHGGGFRWGFKELGEYTCRFVAAEGYTVLNVNYRLAPDHKFPAAVNDCMGAIVWAKQHAAEFDGDPDRVAVGGESAGANLAAMVAYAAGHPRFEPTGVAEADPAPTVNAVIPFYGVFDLEGLAGGQADDILDSYLGSREETDEASPISYLEAPAPPASMFVGSADWLLPQSFDFSDRLADAGIENELSIFPGAEHAFIVWQWDGEPSQEAHLAMVCSLDAQLKPPEGPHTGRSDAPDSRQMRLF